MSYVQALKELAKETGKFVVPKRDTPEYEKVRKIQEKLKKEAEAPKPAVDEKKKRVKKEKVAQPATESTKVVQPAPEKVKEAPVIGEKVAQPASEPTTIITPAPKEKKPRMKKSEKIALEKEELAKETAKPRRFRKSAKKEEVVDSGLPIV